MEDPWAKRGIHQWTARGDPSCQESDKHTQLPLVPFAFDLSGRLAEDNVDIRENAAAILRRMGARRDLDPLPVALNVNHRSPAVRARAADNLGRMGPVASKYSEHLARRLNDDDDNVARACAQALCSLGVDGHHALATSLDNSDARVRCRVAESFKTIGEEAQPFIEALIGRIYDDDETTWRLTADVLADLGSKSARALAGHVGSSDPRCRERALAALLDMGSCGAAAVAKLALPPIKADANAIAQTAKILSHMGPAGNDALARWLQHPDPRFRMIAIEELAKIDSAAGAPPDAIVAQLVDPNPLVSRHAKDVLLQLGSLHVASVARGIQKHVDLTPMCHHAQAHAQRELDADCASVRETCAATLGQMGEAAEAHAECLVDLLEDTRTQVWKTAGETLSQMGTSGASALANRLETLSSKDAHFRMRIEQVLVWMRDDGAAALASKLEAENPLVRMHVARALGRLGETAAPNAEALARSLAYEKDVGVQRAMVDALPRLGAEGIRALTMCIQSSPNPDVRQRATDAIAHSTISGPSTQDCDRILERSEPTSPCSASSLPPLALQRPIFRAIISKAIVC